MRIVELEIKNWDKHNPRTDVKTAKWFKMSNEFFNDPEFYGMSLPGRMVWIFLLCTASKSMTGKIKINTQMVADNLRADIGTIDFAIVELERCGSVIASPLALVPNDINTVESVRIRALEERREEEKREEKKREDICSEQSSKPAKLKIVGHVPEFQKPEFIQDLLKNVLQETQALWLQTYQDVPWIIMEFTKIVNWLQVNPKKRPKSGLDRFINNWLSRGWESHRKTLPASNSKLEHRVVPTITDRQIELLKQAGQI